RTARDAFQTRHGLARRPCRASGEVARLSTVFDARKPFHPALTKYVYSLTGSKCSPLVLYLPLTLSVEESYGICPPQSAGRGVNAGRIGTGAPARVF
ncbi:hypothetical protein F7091_00670, partial [Dickeya dianthicola]|nr:hypothetical protein [Dickeya dianthicola]MBI0488517.1 hypothetical protein [Dickeya dianthicola]MBI0543871.1 hypothetical protein [Dickeya dianthicola]